MTSCMHRLTINHEPDIVVIEGFRNEGTFASKVFRTLGSGMLRTIIGDGDSERVRKEVVGVLT